MKAATMRKRDRGQALVLTAVGMVCLIGFVGLSTDIGLLLRDKVNLQKVADAAAIAGAAQLLTGGSGDYTDAAKDSAAQNGIPLDGSNGTVTVSQGTPYHPAAVKVYVSQSEPTFLMTLFGYRTITVGATAVAGLTNGPGCLYALDLTPDKSQGMTVDGTGSIYAPNCAIIDNSGLVANGTGSGGHGAGITAQSIAVSGAFSGQGTVSPQPNTGALPSPDPLAYWTAPTNALFSGNCVTLAPQSSGTIQPGCYNGLTLTGTVTMAPGLYFIQKGQLNMNGGGSGVNGITGTGVTIFIDGSNGSKASLGTMNNVTLTAPTTGTSGTCTSAGCNGMLIWDTEVNSPDKPQQGIAFGPTTSTLTGVLYFPNAGLKYNGNNTTILNSSIVASSYVFDGAMNINNYILSNGQDPLFQTPTLLE